MIGSPEAADLSKKDKIEGVSRLQQGHTKAEITLMWRQVCAQHQSCLATMSVQTRHHGTQRDLLVPENYQAPHSQTTLPETCLGDHLGF